MADESEKTGLKQLIQGMTGGEVSVIQGKVISASPLKVQAVNDEKLTIFQNSLFVPRHLTDYQTEVTVSWETEDKGGGSGEASYETHRHQIAGRKKIIVHNALKAGETVHLLSLNHGKQYYILDRIKEG